MNAFEWTQPTDLKTALVQANVTVADAMLVTAGKGKAPKDGATVIFKAGGVDLLDLLKEGLVMPSRVVSLKALPGLDGIRAEPKTGLHLGPLVTLARLEREAQLRQSYPVLAEAVAHAATIQLRNAATLGGNLMQRPRCWYFRNEHFVCRKKGGEKCFANEGENKFHAIFNNGVCSAVHASTLSTALVALGAHLELTGPKGTRQVSLEDFFVTPDKDVTREAAIGPNELITDVILPPPALGTRSGYLKQGERESYDWALVDVAVVLDLADGRCRSASVVLGSVAPVPLRAKGAEAALVGGPVNQTTAAAAARAAVSGATPLAHNAYKVPLLEAVVRRTILKAVES
jgi:xanthine dehydrogenase YagS FAD-binding subunit